MQRRGDEPRGSLPSEPALRIIMRRLREIMAEPVDGQSRLDKIVRQIAGLMVAEVCSIYLKRQDGSLELFATEGLNPGAVHNTLMKRGEGLVGRCAELAVPINEPDAQNHPAFSYRPETGEEIYHSFLAVPILRGGEVLGVLIVQNTHAQGILRRGRRGAADDGDGAGRASRVRRGRRRQYRRRVRHVLVGHVIARPAALGGHRARPRRAARAARRRHRARWPRTRRRRAAGSRPPSTSCKASLDEMLEQGELAGDRRAPRGARGLPHVRPRPRLAAAHEGGGQARPDRRGRRRARAERHPRAHAAPGRPLLARAPARPRRPVRPAAAHPAGRQHQRGRRRRQAAARHDPGRPHHGAGRAARLRPHAAARPGDRGWRRPEPRRHRRQGAGHRRRRPGARHRRARRARATPSSSMPRAARCTSAPPPRWSPPMPTRSASAPAASASTARCATCPPSPRTASASSCT